MARLPSLHPPEPLPGASLQAKSQFKRRSTANNVEIHIPVPNDADSPKFKTTVGSVKWVPENSEIVWSIKSFPVSSIFISLNSPPHVTTSSGTVFLGARGSPGEWHPGPRNTGAVPLCIPAGLGEDRPQIHPRRPCPWCPNTATIKGSHYVWTLPCHLCPGLRLC